MKTAVYALESLLPHESNAGIRKISKRAERALSASIGTYGNIQPVVVNERNGKLVGGHQRVKAMKDMGRKDTEAYVIDLDEEAHVRASLMLNNHVGKYEEDQLVELLADIKECPELPNESTGFSDKEITALTEPLPPIDIETPSDKFIDEIYFESAEQKKQFTKVLEDIHQKYKQTHKGDSIIQAIKGHHDQ